MNDTTTFDRSTFPVLTTTRLTLREVLPSDAPDVLIFRGDAQVQRYNGPIMQDAHFISGVAPGPNLSLNGPLFWIGKERMFLPYRTLDISAIGKG